jgi:glycerate kinase
MIIAQRREQKCPRGSGLAHEEGSLGAQRARLGMTTRGKKLREIPHCGAGGIPSPARLARNDHDKQSRRAANLRGRFAADVEGSLFGPAGNSMTHAKQG